MKKWLGRLDAVGFLLVVLVLVRYSSLSVWTLYDTVAIILGIALILIAVTVKRNEIRQTLSSRNARYGANSLTSVLLLVGVLGLVGYLGYQNNRRIDLTTEQMFSLSDQSATVADQLEEDVHIRAFFPSGRDPQVRNMLDLYTSQSPRITYEFIDPDRQPQLAEQFDVTVYGTFNNPMTGEGFNFGTIVMETPGFEERIEKQSEPLREEDVTNALMKLIKGEQKKVYFIEGHGEKLISDTERNGLDAARSALERENYVVESLNLVRVDALPEDAAALVWAGPQSEPFPEEIDMVDAYLNAGGSVLLMLDPPPAASLDSLLERWGVTAGSNFIVDASGVGRLLGAGPEIPLVSQYGSHAITDRFNLMTFFPLARSIDTAAVDDETQTATRLLTTGSNSWGESDLESLEAAFDPSLDLQGPVDIGAVLTRDLEGDLQARLAVVGDSDFATNGFFDLQGNGNLFLNAVSWLAEDESFISIRPKAPTDRPLNLTESQGQISYYITMVLMPLSILVAGVSVWIRRRNQ